MLAAGAKVRHRDHARLRLGRRDREGVHRRRAARRSTTTARSPAAPRPSTSPSTATRSDWPRPPASSPRLKGKTKPVVAELWGGQSDANASWFKSGNDDILNPLFKSGKISEGPAAVRARPGSANGAATIFAQMLVKTNNKIDGVIAANDNIAGAVVVAAEGQAPEADPAQRPGRDRRRACRTSSPAGRRNGLQAGARCRRTPRPRPRSRSSRARSRPRPRRRFNGKKQVPTVALPVAWITKANVKQALRGQVPQEERRLRRRVQEVLLVDRHIT